MSNTREQTERMIRRLEAEERFESDRHRPRYHFLPPANWLNDPNGPIWFDGRYHLFYQHNPDEAKWGNIHWGHAVSPDLVHWEDWPIALTPDTEGVDESHCFTGCAFVQEDGTPTIAYTGIIPAEDGDRRHESQSLAVSEDGMLTWQKIPQNPVIAAPPEGREVTGFRDPCVWQEGDTWYMVIGSGIEGEGGAVLAYRSRDLIDWEYLGPLMVGDAEEHGTMWECPDFFRLGQKHLLLVSTLGRQMYVTGGWDRKEFMPTGQGWLDYSPTFYAGKSFEDPHGRRILWGWLREAREDSAQIAAGWSGVMSLPRVMQIGPDGQPGCEPAEELRRLRAASVTHEGLELRTGQQRELDFDGDCLEIEAEINVPPDARFTVDVRCSPDGEERTEVYCDAHQGVLGIDTRASSLDRSAQTRVSCGPLALRRDEPLRLRIFVDRSVVEVFANGRACVTERAYPTRLDSTRVRAGVLGTDATVERLSAWKMRSIWRTVTHLVGGR